MLPQKAPEKHLIFLLMDATFWLIQEAAVLFKGNVYLAQEEK